MANLFEILEVNPSNDLAEIKKAYRNKSLQIHPDKHRNESPDKSADYHKQFLELKDAYNQIDEQEKLDAYFMQIQRDEASKKARLQREEINQTYEAHAKQHNGQSYSTVMASSTKVEQENYKNREDYKDYITKYGSKFDDPESGYSEPKIDEEGKLTLSFPSEIEMFKDCEEQAKKGRIFEVADESGKVICYSKGDGVFHKNREPKSQAESIAESMRKHLGTDSSEFQNLDRAAAKNTRTIPTMSAPSNTKNPSFAPEMSKDKAHEKASTTDLQSPETLKPDTTYRGPHR